MATCSVKGQAASFLRYRHAVVSYFVFFKTIRSVKTTVTPRPIVDIDQLSGLNGLYPVAVRDVAGVGISEVYKQW